MSDMNMANRQCCDLDIRNYADKSPFLYADFCNTTTAGFNSDAVYAMKKGAKCIKFDNPLDGTISMTFQTHPFRIYSMLSDGEIETQAIVAVRETVTATGTDKLTVKGTPIAGTVFAYEEGDFGGTPVSVQSTGSEITGTFTSGTTYEVGYLESKNSGVKKITFNNKKVPKFFYVQMSTVDKDENGDLVPMRITCYKACPQRSLDLSFSSTGDPSEITITMDALMDENGDVLDMIELTDED